MQSPRSSSPTVGNGFDGTQVVAVVPNPNSSVTTAPSLASSPTQLVSFILRFTALATTFIATIVMGVNKEIVVFDGDEVELTIKNTGASQLEYFVAVNAIAFVYSSASLGMSILNRMNNSMFKNFTLVITVLDMVMVALLFSGNGSASAIGVLARNGAGDLWPNFCDAFGKYCGNMAAAIVMSMFGALAFFALVLFSHVGLYNTK